MSKSKRSDASQNAKRIVAESTVKHEEPLPADIEAAWDAWIAGVGKVDQRAGTLLRAAFEVGVAAGKRARKRQASEAA